MLLSARPFDFHFWRFAITCLYYGAAVLISGNFGRNFSFILSLYLETKMLNSLSHILVVHSFSRRKAIAF